MPLNNLSSLQGQIDLKAPLASPTFTGTVTLPAVTLGGLITSGVYGTLVRNVTNSAVLLAGGTNAAGKGAQVILWGSTHGWTGRFEVLTPNAAENADVQRLAISGVAATAVATWTATTHTGLVITSAGTLEGAGTGANGFKLKNLKNAAASALSGTQLDVEIDIGGTPYYFTVYPTKA